MSKSQINSGAKYDILVWGATGYTGTLTAEFFARDAPRDVKFAIGGRNESKLLEVKNKLLEINPSCEVGVI